VDLCLVDEGYCDVYFECSKKKNSECLSYYKISSLIAREAGTYTCDPSGRIKLRYLSLPGALLNIVHRRILCAATKELAEQILPSRLKEQGHIRNFMKRNQIIAFLINKFLLF
jgi:hypothetical protein